MLSLYVESGLLRKNIAVAVSAAKSQFERDRAETMARCHAMNACRLANAVLDAIPSRALGAEYVVLDGAVWMLDSDDAGMWLTPVTVPGVETPALPRCLGCSEQWHREGNMSNGDSFAAVWHRYGPDGIQALACEECGHEHAVLAKFTNMASVGAGKV